jgi:hypothetical protein
MHEAVSLADAAGRRRPFLWGPAAVVAISVLLALGLMLTNHDDPSYSCGHVAIVDVINPEPEGSPAFRANFFDAGHACNRDARVHVGAAAVLLVIGGLASGLWTRRRSRDES